MALINLYLKALKYPELEQGFDPSEPSHYQAVVVWLENTKIRHYPLDARAQLQAAEPLAWTTALQSYLTELACPVQWNDSDLTRIPILQWLLNYAVGLEFADNKEKYTQHIDEAVSAAVTPQEWAPPPLPPYADATAPQTLSALQHVLESLQVPLGPGDTAAVTPAQLQKAKSMLEAQVLPCLAEASRSADGAVTPSSVLSGYPLGFSTGDAMVDLAATVLRMLYIKDTRELQDQVDAAIVRMQELTANPRTDAAAGRVGR